MGCSCSSTFEHDSVARLQTEVLHLSYETILHTYMHTVNAGDDKLAEVLIANGADPDIEVILLVP
jgi:hypothetical protein